jgi:large subunit ribosomal protein L4
MKADIYNIKGEKVGDLTLPKTVFEVEPNNTLIARFIRVFLSNQRHSFAKTKGRGDVAGTTKKMWAQKGTGRARHSSAKAPQFVGGGSAHGPIGVQNYSLNLPKKQKKLATFAVLSKFAKNKSIMIIDEFKDLEPKTKTGFGLIDILEKAEKNLADSKKIGIVTAANPQNVLRAFRNIPGFTMISLNSLNAYDLSQQNYLIFSQKAITELSK